MSGEQLPIAFVRARKPDGSECTVDLTELENALDGGWPGQAYLVPDTGQILHSSSEFDDFGDEDADEEIPDNVLEVESIASHTKFRWMESFTDTVRSIPLQSALRRALRDRKPFRNFKDELMGYPSERQRWFQFEREQVKDEAVSFLESFDWDILEVVDERIAEIVAAHVDPEERVPITTEEHEWILRGAWRIALRGGRTQLGLLLKGSRNRNLLKHNLETFPAYGKLSFLTLEEIEKRIDRIIRKGDLQIEFSGDLPVIRLTDQASTRVAAWANEYECREAAAADDKTLKMLLGDWRNRRKDRQVEMIEASACLTPEDRRKLLLEFSGVAGKDIRAVIEKTLSSQQVPESGQSRSLVGSDHSNPKL
jgi:hypothetical protein